MRTRQVWSPRARRPLLPLAAILALLTSCGSPGKGALVLALGSDMQTPKDVDVVSVFISTNSAVKLDYLGRMLPDGTVALPATLAVVEPDDPSAQLRIRVIAFREQQARVLRDVLTTVPHQRTALLRLPLDFLDDGSAIGTLPLADVPLGAGGAPEGNSDFNPDLVSSRCDFSSGKTSIAGVCSDASVDSSKLPDYALGEVYGDGGLLGNGAPSTCFDVATCFRAASPVEGLDAKACTFPLPAGADPARLNVAFVTPSTGACLAPGRCYVPLVDDPGQGWSAQGGTVTLTPGVCTKLKAAAGSLALAVSAGACAAEVDADPVCEPTGPDAGEPVIDASAPTDAAVGGGS